jgi:hypothetical protein
MCETKFHTNTKHRVKFYIRTKPKMRNKDGQTEVAPFLMNRTLSRCRSQALKHFYTNHWARLQRASNDGTSGGKSRAPSFIMKDNYTHRKSHRASGHFELHWCGISKQDISSSLVQHELHSNTTCKFANHIIGLQFAIPTVVNWLRERHSYSEKFFECYAKPWLFIHKNHIPTLKMYTRQYH